MANYEQYLKRNLSKYKNKSITKASVLTALKDFPELHPIYDTRVFSDNTRKRMLSLNGTIPVKVGVSTYHIPICIWLWEEHPHKPPICYVVPREGMIVRPTKHVDVHGKVYLPYLHQWKHPKTDIIGLIRVLVYEFSQRIPLHERPSQMPERKAPSPPFDPLPPPRRLGFERFMDGENDPAPEYQNSPRSPTEKNHPVLRKEEDSSYVIMCHPKTKSMLEEMEERRLKLQEREKLLAEEEYREQRKKLEEERKRDLEGLQVGWEQLRQEREQLQNERARLQNHGETAQVIKSLEEQMNKLQMKIDRLQTERECEYNGCPSRSSSTRSQQSEEEQMPSGDSNRASYISILSDYEDSNLTAKLPLSYGEMKNMVADLLDGDHRLRIMNHLEWSPTVVENVKTSLELMAKMEAMGVFSKQDTSALTKLLMKSNCVIAAEIAGDYRPENLYFN